MFLLFAGWRHYPSGGIEDFIGEFDSLNATLKHLESVWDEDRYEWSQIVDKKTMKIVEGLK